MRYLQTTYEQYKLFIERHKTSRLSKNVKLTTVSTNYSKLLFGINEEIFNNPLNTDYEISEHKNISGKKVIFKTNSNTEYRLDIFPIIESNEIINHISFSLNKEELDVIPSNEEDYELYNNLYDEQTNKREMIEVMNRIHFILNDLVKKNIIVNMFCIGGTAIESKNNIYEYFLKIVVGSNGFEKRQTNVYPKIGWGLYFSI